MAVPAAPTAGEPIAEAWGDVVHDAIVAQDLQFGYAQGTFSANNGINVAVTFPRPFGGAGPYVLVSANDAITAAVTAKITAGTITTTGFSCKLSTATGATASGTVGFYWVAFGPRA